jgi:hypothetical protein
MSICCFSGIRTFLAHKIRYSPVFVSYYGKFKGLDRIADQLLYGVSEGRLVVSGFPKSPALPITLAATLSKMSRCFPFGIDRLNPICNTLAVVPLLPYNQLRAALQLPGSGSLSPPQKADTIS